MVHVTICPRVNIHQKINCPFKLDFFSANLHMTSCPFQPSCEERDIVQEGDDALEERFTTFIHYILFWSLGVSKNQIWANLLAKSFIFIFFRVLLKKLAGKKEKEHHPRLQFKKVRHLIQYFILS